MTVLTDEPISSLEILTDFPGALLLAQTGPIRRQTAVKGLLTLIVVGCNQ